MKIKRFTSPCNKAKSFLVRIIFDSFGEYSLVNRWNTMFFSTLKILCQNLISSKMFNVMLNPFFVVVRINFFTLYINSVKTWYLVVVWQYLHQEQDMRNAGIQSVLLASAVMSYLWIWYIFSKMASCIVEDIMLNLLNLDVLPVMRYNAREYFFSHYNYCNFFCHKIYKLQLKDLAMEVRFGLWCLTPLSTICQLYCGGQFYWWRKPEYGRKQPTCGKSLTIFIT